MAKITISLPLRRYAMFWDSIRCRNYMIVISGNDLDYAPLWGNFVTWVGAIKQPTIITK